MQFFRTGGDDGDGSAQFVGCVRGKLALPLKRILQADQHGVEGVSQFLYLVPGGDAGDPPGQIPSAYLLRRPA